jgi:hypothetical protein
VDEPDVVLDGAAGVEAGALGVLSLDLDSDLDSDLESDLASDFESDLVSEDAVSFLDSVAESEAGAELLLA